MIPTDNLLIVAATELSLLLAALAGNNKDGEGGGRVGGKSIPAVAGIDTATESAIADEGESYLFIDMIPTDNLLSVAATEPTSLLFTLVNNSEVGEGGGRVVDIILLILLYIIIYII
ncbi:hypothetical protein CDIK_3246 [Cucumispora dikerogammari]|nr:hypothetical protein CDIK_3246 [Cucumispora dikerogammari]